MKAGLPAGLTVATSLITFILGAWIGDVTGFSLGQEEAYSNHWYLQPVKTADGHLRYESLTKPVARPTTAE